MSNQARRQRKEDPAFLLAFSSALGLRLITVFLRLLELGRTTAAALSGHSHGPQFFVIEIVGKMVHDMVCPRLFLGKSAKSRRMKPAVFFYLT